MRTTIHLLISEIGTVNAYKARHRPGPNQVALALSLEFPDELFRKPSLEATITVPSGVIAPAMIEATVAEEIAKAIETYTGLEAQVTISGIEPPTGDATKENEVER